MTVAWVGESRWMDGWIVGLANVGVGVSRGSVGEVDRGRWGSGSVDRAATWGRRWWTLVERGGAGVR